MPQESNTASGILEARVSQGGEGTTLTLAGELDLATADIVREKLEEARGQGTSRVVVDLRRLTFIDSTGIWLLLSAVKEEEGRLSFIPSESAAVQRVFAVTGVTDLFGGDGETPAALNDNDG